MPSTFAGGVRRLIFTGNVKTNLDNKYVGGAGVGAHSTAARRALKRRATSSKGSLGPNNTLVGYNRVVEQSNGENRNRVVEQSNAEPSYNISPTLMAQFTHNATVQSIPIPSWHPYYGYYYSVINNGLNTPEQQEEIRNSIIQQHPDPTDPIYST